VLFNNSLHLRRENSWVIPGTVLSEIVQGKTKARKKKGITRSLSGEEIRDSEERNDYSGRGGRASSSL